ncbi:Glutathione synthetase [Coemansia umbellata]|uniref:Glutathione synthetase n=1 Tax=Coemansia umbellata TaxID=1424467 RepID=A0ABQ8PR08_9FUNG|nr:Glutathione synthetase [Coemansia umbellata]
MSKLSLTNSEFLSFRPKYTSDLSKLQRYVGAAVDWEATHGLLFKAPKPSCDQSSNSSSKEGWMESALIPAPVSFAPSPIPRQEFEKVVALQPTLNQLFDKVSKDHEFLISTLNSLGSADEFTSRIFTMYVQLHSLGVKKPAVIGIHRSDYLIHAPDNEPDASPKAKQVEFNTIASSFASLSSIVGNFHRYMLGRTGYKGLLEDGDILKDQLPENESLTSIGDALASGFKLYGNKDAVIVMVVQPGERNVYDQRWIETRLWERHNIAVVRMTFAEINDKCATDSESRLFMFLGDADKAAFVRGCFVGLYPLDESAEGIKAYQDAISNPANYVVKPQREGGGYNTYGNDIPSLLKGLSEEERKAYILMDLIRAPGFKNVLLREGKLIAGEVVSELGIYGIWVSDANDNVVVNRHGGHLLRTKASDVYEGGVAAGFAVIDSPLLV